MELVEHSSGGVLEIRGSEDGNRVRRKSLRELSSAIMVFPGCDTRCHCDSFSAASSHDATPDIMVVHSPGAMMCGCVSCSGWPKRPPTLIVN